MRIVVFLVFLGLMHGEGRGQSDWSVAQANRHVQMDGRLDEWEGVSEIVLEPRAGTVQATGEFGENDVRVTLRALWSKEGLHLAIDWSDDSWDVENVQRKDAIWISPEGKRRNRMYYYDNLKLELHRSNFHYTVWVSARTDELGPFSWSRMFGKKRLEMASSPPLITSAVSSNRVTMEWLFPWKELRLKPKSYKDLVYRIEVTDSDLPGAALESKMPKLKALDETGLLLIRKK